MAERSEIEICNLPRIVGVHANTKEMVAGADRSRSHHSRISDRVDARISPCPIYLYAILAQHLVLFHQQHFSYRTSGFTHQTIKIYPAGKGIGIP